MELKAQYPCCVCFKLFKQLAKEHGKEMAYVDIRKYLVAGEIYQKDTHIDSLARNRRVVNVKHQLVGARFHVCTGIFTNWRPDVAFYK